MGVLYRITNNVNKKMYFGQTIREPEERKTELLFKIQWKILKEFYKPK